MAIKERIKRLEKKSGGTDNFLKVPKRERVVWAAGYTQSECDDKFAEKIKILHEKYGDFDESCLQIIEFKLRKFYLTEEGIVAEVPEEQIGNVLSPDGKKPEHRQECG